MKKIANIIVEKRILIVIFMLMLTVASFFGMKKVNINSDMTKYLPDDSEMKQGIALMDREFKGMNTMQTIKVMFKGLNAEERLKMSEELAEIKYVDSVAYEEDSDLYNRGDYAKYVLRTGYEYNSDEELAIEKKLTDDFANHNMVYETDNETEARIPVWIIAVALGIAFIILLLMSGSWLDPPLLMVTIGIAVVLNMGSNILLGTVSETTYSIAAILQMVLSMDYSIILMNRYRQEKQRIPDKKEAMKVALANAFSSIASSSMTTVIGLLALVFMRFKIGFDLGVVLAKGVAISMICVMVLMPFLILLMDKPLRKMEKKVWHMPTGKLASFEFRGRIVITVAFIMLFGAVFLGRGGTKILFSSVAADPIDDIFPKTYTTAVLYDKKDEKAVTRLTEEIKKWKNVENADNYSTTLNKPYKVNELSSKMEDVYSKIDKDMLSLLYYDYYKNGKTEPMTIEELLNFIAQERKGFDGAAKYADRKTLVAKHSCGKLAEFFDMSEEQCKQLMTLYYINHGGASTGVMPLSVFVDFLINEVAHDNNYSSMLDRDTLTSVKKLQIFTNKPAMTKTRNYKDSASVLSIGSKDMCMVYSYYFAKKGAYVGRMTLPEIASMMKKAGNHRAAELSFYTDKNKIIKRRSAKGLADLFGIRQSQMVRLLGLYAALNGKDRASTAKIRISPADFTDFMVTSVIPNPEYGATINKSQAKQIKNLDMIIKMTLSGRKIKYGEAAKLFGADVSSMKILYMYKKILTLPEKYKMSVARVVGFILNNSSKFGEKISEKQKQQLYHLSGIINGTVNNKQYSYGSMAPLMGANDMKIRALYLLYRGKHGDTSGWGLSPKKFVDFIDDEVLSDAQYSYQIKNSSAAKLRQGRKLIDAVAGGEKYTYTQAYKLLSGISDLNRGVSVKKRDMSLLYLYYGAKHLSNPKWTMTVEQLADFISDDVLKDPRFKGQFDAAARRDIKSMRSKIADAKEKLVGEKYSLMSVVTSIEPESEESVRFFSKLRKTLETGNSGKSYLVGNAAMSDEMRSTFSSDNSTVMFLTVISIFLVVLFTFRSLAVPVILVMLVQCGVFAAVCAIGLMGGDIHYLALLIVQCILMGATIDYGILFAAYYRENRRSTGRRKALADAYRGSIGTILTSGIILIFVTGVLGELWPDPAIADIVKTIAIGATCSVMLILFMLPGILVTLDRFVMQSRKR